MTHSSKKSWICLKEDTVLQTPIMEITQQDCESSEDQRPHQFYRIKAPDWCNVIPITDTGKIVLVRQFRIGTGTHTLEIPGGVIDPTDRSIESAAIREMAEETGYVPVQDARCIPLGWTHPNPAIQNNRCHAFIVGPVKKQKDQHLDSGEMIEIIEVPVADFFEKLTDGEISHALILNAFLFLLLKSPEAQSLLQGQLTLFTSPSSGAR